MSEKLKAISKPLLRLFENFVQADAVVDDALTALRTKGRAKYKLKCYEVLTFLEAREGVREPKYPAKLADAREKFNAHVGAVTEKLTDLKCRLIGLNDDRKTQWGSVEAIVRTYDLTQREKDKLKALKAIGEKIDTMGFTDKDIDAWESVIAELDKIGFEEAHK